ncbi:hypothetical protein H1R20_g2710, partial [Candolleomyces eurysporus]
MKVYFDKHLATVPWVDERKASAADINKLNPLRWSTCLGIDRDLDAVGQHRDHGQVTNCLAKLKALAWPTHFA